MDWSNRLGKRIKLRDLHILQAAAEAGSMVKAASDLAMTSACRVLRCRRDGARVGRTAVGA